jgi:hypothetical protein
VIATELARHLTDETLKAMAAARGDRPPMIYKTVEAGAATSVWAGVVADADAVGGRYCEDCSVSDLIEVSNQATGVMAYAVDPQHARALWARSEELVGESFH